MCTGMTPAGRQTDSPSGCDASAICLTAIDIVPRPAAPGELGAVVDIVVAAAGSGGLAVALVRSLRSWLKAKAARVTIEIRTVKGSANLDARNIDSAETRALLDQILDFYDDRPT